MGPHLKQAFKYIGNTLYRDDGKPHTIAKMRVTYNRIIAPEIRGKAARKYAKRLVLVWDDLIMCGTSLADREQAARLLIRLDEGLIALQTMMSVEEKKEEDLR